MTDRAPLRSRPRGSIWPLTDATAPSRLGNYPAGEASSADLAESLAHTLRDIDQERVGARLGEAVMGEGPEHPAYTVVRALFEDAHTAGEKPPHFDDPDFRETAYALGQRLVREYAPEPSQPQAEIEGPQHG